MVVLLLLLLLKSIDIILGHNPYDHVAVVSRGYFNDLPLSERCFFFFFFMCDSTGEQPVSR